MSIANNNYNHSYQDHTNFSFVNNVGVCFVIMSYIYIILLYFLCNNVKKKQNVHIDKTNIIKIVYIVLSVVRLTELCVLVSLIRLFLL